MALLGVSLLGCAQGETASTQDLSGRPRLRPDSGIVLLDGAAPLLADAGPAYPPTYGDAGYYAAPDSGYVPVPPDAGGYYPPAPPDAGGYYPPAPVDAGYYPPYSPDAGDGSGYYPPYSPDAGYYPPPPPPGGSGTPTSGTLCAPCYGPGSCGPGAACLFDIAGDTICGQDCTSAPCPSGFSCLPLSDGVGSPEQCFPDSGFCDGGGGGFGFGF